MSSTIPSYAYFASLLFALVGLLFWDFKSKLALFDDPIALLRVMGVSLGFFLIWDISGIVLNVFHTNTRFTIGLNIISPDLPIEELLFLLFLSYIVLLATRASQKR